MKNVRPNQLKKCIYLYCEEYKSILCEIFGESISIDECDGCVSIWNNGENTSEISFDDLTTALAKYFDVATIESVHVDCDEYLGVWIVYAEKDVEE